MDERPDPQPDPQAGATPSDGRPVLVTGATGYVGGRLVPLLLSRGVRVRAAGRSAAKLAARPWADHELVELAELDVLDPDSLAAALSDCRAAYYLVHSMGPARGPAPRSAGHDHFADTDRRAAEAFAAAAAEAGLSRIIYLGGMGDDSPELSEHLRSRLEVGRILSGGEVPCTWLRAAVILGSGSASFEIVRSLVSRLPVMITPRWVNTRSQPIAIADVLGYLADSLEIPATAGQTLDIGGPDVVTYRELFDLFADEAGLRRRLVLPVPWLTPRLSAYWVNLVTPVPMSLIRPLVEGLRNEVVCADDRAQRLMPRRLVSCREAIRRALDDTARRGVATCCFDAGTACLPEWAASDDARWAGGPVLETAWSAPLGAPAEAVWPAVAGIGGDTGWYFGNPLWRLRGFIDKLLGGPGLRRGRRDPQEIRPGDALDFWRVAELDPPRRLVLAAEMKLPGEAVLLITLNDLPAKPPSGEETTGDAKGQTSAAGCELVLRARFLPRGLWGEIYWWSMYPFHLLLFHTMPARLARRAGAPLLGPVRPRRPGDSPAGSCGLRGGKRP